MKSKHYTIPVFVPELACPFQCVYCNQKKISGQMNIPDEEEIVSTIEAHLSTFPKNNVEIEIGFFGGNFTGIPMEEQEKYLGIAKRYIRAGSIQSVRLSTRPDYIRQDILDMLKKYHVRTIELGAQSMDDEVLKLSRRGHDSQSIEKAAALIRQNAFRLGLQMMIGLPGDDLSKSLCTARKIVELKADDARIYPCLVIRGTKLADWYQSGKYKVLQLDEAVEQSKAVLLELEKGNVNIIRTGLHPSEALTTDKDLLAGPYHPAFKELVMTAIWRDLFMELLKEHEQNNIRIYVSTKELPYAIGHQALNRKALEEFYNKVKFIGDEKLRDRDFRVEVF